MKMHGAKIHPAAAPKPMTGIPKPGMVHPAAPHSTKVRLPDTGSIGADPSPVVPSAGKI